MGHETEIGFVSTEAYGQAVLFRIDTPELPEREFTLTSPKTVGFKRMPAGTKVKRPAAPGKSRLVAPGSLYAINPCTEEAARTALERILDRKLILVDAPKAEIDDDPPVLRDIQACLQEIHAGGKEK